MRRRFIGFTVVTLVVTLVGPLPALAAPFDPSGIVFPVIGQVSFIDDFYSTRSGGRIHGATDIMTGGVKGFPVLAAADGVVGWIGDTCCYMSIVHEGGWETWYIHLDNDTPGTDDGLAWGIAPGIAPGVSVVKGQLIGWVGDSGNAESVGPHLHFEIRQDGVPINPHPYLLVAPRLTAPVPASYVGHFSDDEGSVHEADIDTLYAAGITAGCSVEEPLYCPDQEITRGQIAAFIQRAFDLPVPTEDFFADDSGDIFEGAINAITKAGIGFGCTASEYCSTQPLLREEMAELLVRAFAVPPTDIDQFSDDADSPFQNSINALWQAGITRGCDPNDATRFCPDLPLTRAQMATFFVRAMGL